MTDRLLAFRKRQSLVVILITVLLITVIWTG